MAAIKGPPADDDFLKANGFQLTGDILGNRYYMGSMNRLLWFSADGTWGANPRPKEGMGFEDYVRAATLEELVL